MTVTSIRPDFIVSLGEIAASEVPIIRRALTQAEIDHERRLKNSRRNLRDAADAEGEEYLEGVVEEVSAELKAIRILRDRAYRVAL